VYAHLHASSYGNVVVEGVFPPAPYSKQIGQRVSCRSSCLLQDGDGGGGGGLYQNGDYLT
jgi:hypothetical protein